MKHHYFKSIILCLTLLLFSGLTAQNQQSSLWTKTTQQKASIGKQLHRKSQPKQKGFYQLELNALKTILKEAPLKGVSAKASNVIVDFPLADGTFESFRVIEAPIMNPDLQADMPNSRTYIGQSTTNPINRIRFSITAQGLHTMLFSPKKGMQFIDPVSYGGNKYMVYKKKDLPTFKEGFVCEVIDEITADANLDFDLEAAKNANDGMLRDFRLAIATTIEYSQFHWEAAGLTAGDTEADKKDAVMDAMIVTMNRVNGVFENELSVTMTFVANNKDIIFIDSDSFNNDNAGVLIGQSQTVIDGAIGDANYDIGHTFSTGGGGLATLNSPCVSGSKARGITGLSSPVGDSYDIDFVAHEIGHQFGAPHTFNGVNGSCSGANRTASNAYEPGSGSTIMAYAGICGADNVQGNSDAYFHQKSLQMMWDNLTPGGTVSNSTCAAQTSTGNTVPTAEAGANYTIPISTPYKLTGASTETNGDPTSTHTFTWEQYDLGTAESMPTETTDPGPIVRSFEGTDNPARYIPRLQDLNNSGGSTTWEKLASISRDINFQLTVRDNDVRGGQTATDNMTVTTTDAAGPFLVTSQNTTGISWAQSTTETITWDVAGTTGNGVNVANVNIWLSTDGGQTYSTNLAMNTPNDGSQDITVPNIMAAYCRIMVEASGNIFFAINSEDFAIGYIVSQTCNQYTSTDPALPISITDDGDNYTETSGVNVPDSETITDVKLTVNITHPWPGDLLLGLQSPNSTLLNMLEPYSPCQNEDEDVIATFDDAGIAFSCNTTGDGLTMQSPISSLNGWNGENSAGTWILGVGDFGAQDLGTLNSWSIEICYDVLTALSTNEFDPAHFALFPNPNNGEFTLKLKSTSNNNIQVNVYDIRGREVYNNSYRNTVDFNESIKLNNVQSGLYLLKVNDGERQTTKKIIIE